MHVTLRMPLDTVRYLHLQGIQSMMAHNEQYKVLQQDFRCEHFWQQTIS